MLVGSAVEPDSNHDGTKGEGTASKQNLHGAMAGTGSTAQETLVGLICGLAYGSVSPIVGHPFDSVKTRMQADPKYRHTTAMETARMIYRTEGFMGGFYRGLLPPMVGSMAYRGIMFSSYSGAYAACEHIPALHEPIPFTYGLRPSVLVGGFAAALSRAVLESPLDYIKVRYMVGKAAMNDTAAATSATTTTASAATTTTTTAAADGTVRIAARATVVNPVSSIRQLYHGFYPTLFRTVGLVGSFFVMIDYSVRLIPDVVNAPLLGPFFKGGICATTAWVFAFPFEAVKSVIQADTTGKYKKMKGATFKVMADIYRERGLVKGLYRGFAPGASRSFVANGASMMVYTRFQEFLRER